VIVGVGVDVVDIARMAAVLDRTPSVLGRLFTAGEQAHCVGRPARARVASLAARFAAKEAVAKALGTGVRGFAFVDVEVVVGDLGQPGVQLHARAAGVAADRGISTIHLSLSTSDLVATAFVVAESATP
jgi:holo-[acyl-carrier protein] synthase